MSRAVAVAVAVLTLVNASEARAEDPRIAAARTAYEAQDQHRTVALLAPVVASASLTDHDRAAALRLVGCAHMVLEQRADALTAFRASFALEPDAALEPQLASSIDARSLFEVARGEWRAALVSEMADQAAEIAKLALSVDAPARARGGQPISIAVQVGDPAHLASRVELSYRRRGQGSFTLLTERLTPVARPAPFVIPAEVTASAKPFVLEYHVTLRHPTGFDLRRGGDPDHPRIIAVEAGRLPRWYDSWRVRGVLALGVVGLGVGGYFWYRSFDVGPQRVVFE